MHFFIAAILAVFSANLFANSEQDLPSLGDSTSGLISMEQEYKLGRTWLRKLRQNASSINDPLIKEYTENLIYRLATHSQVSDRRFEIIILDNEQLNAFAVPGGIIGINAGLFLYAQTEAQFASVVAHELAHLSQRHFARQVDESRKQAPIALASLLGSILLLATNNTEAGFAGLVTSQAAATQNSLSYSRDWEREADRIGLQTLVSAQIDPRGMPQMFEQMFAAHKYSQRPPEFLMTHPITANRISDAAARVDNLDVPVTAPDFEYSLRRTALLIRYRPESHSREYFEKVLKTSKTQSAQQRARYALALIDLQKDQYASAHEFAINLVEQDPHRISYQVLKAKTLFKLGQQDEAINYTEELLELNPDNHPLTMTYVELLSDKGEHHKAAIQLRSHSIQRNYDAYIWQKLGELEAKAGNEVATFQARAEYFFLTGRKKQALSQLKQALDLSQDKYMLTAKIQQRAREIAGSADNLQF
ncbi:M48 family metallopeptidase [Bermanella marisrubri]|uniref:Putative beta-barrel assembly-enhancing protease n=1 Tax=Bermanella marisrubri TaxID=207949 RepID=Q1N0S8_9GAMM|nr:M48 family metalloprotease [Bermanella marisrubri]EAT11755.1 putative Zn-dependent protease, contains TPR repeats [Oceanobacter sp. RED65] [Bermanella marisrubri]QIZ83791.1 M48 family metallopeptidase [Bermanella marisrubri]